MKEHNEFDELARRKLAERQFHFQEAHWNDMEELLDAGGRRRRLVAWWLFPALLLLIGGGGAFLYFSNEPVQKEALGTKQETPIEKSAAPPSAFQPIAATIDSATTASNIETPIPEIEPNRVDPIVPIEKHGASISPDQQLKDVPRNGRNDEPAIVSNYTKASPGEPVEVAQEEPMDVDLHPENTETPSADPFEENVVATDPMQDPFFAINEEENDPTVTGADQKEDVASTEEPTSPMENTNDAADAAQMNDRYEEGADAEHDGTGAESTEAGHEGRSQADAGNVPPNEEGVVPGTRPPQEHRSTPQDTLSDVNADPPATPDTMVTADPAPSDTPVPPEPQATPTPIVDPRSPFEIGIHAGLLYTTSNYSGPQSEGQFRSIEQQRNYTGGLEFMRMGRNIGVGSGIHYSTYSERIAMDHIDRTESTQSQYYFLTPVDTTLLIITDSIEVNGTMQYTGQSVYTTVHVLDQAMQTITTITRIRDAREQLNRTSYLEIPLLFDVHVVQGRWNLGLRGGPTLGILSTSSGSLPNSTYDGYLDLSDQQFRSLVLGYTGRAYVRYRFNSAWSIGLEPTVRGHLQNGLKGGQLTRRPIGYGGMFSLNYRFR